MSAPTDPTVMSLRSFWVVIPDHAPHPVSEKIDQVPAGLHDECHRRGRGLMQEIRVMADREFLILNLPE